MKRVMVIGGAGSGKSTLAVSLGKLTGLPVIHIDPMYWKPGWVKRDSSDTRALVLEASAGDAWIFEGNNSSTFEQRLSRADTLIFLDLPTPLRTWRVLRRTVTNYGGSRPDMAEECPERFDWSFTKWVVEYFKLGRPKALALLSRAPDYVETVHLRSRREVDAYLTNLASVAD